ncbi:MAG: hypothetical protein A2487_00790 [Candidatus Raymondbacteria bacterium RifOxyC12_full_50_8]|uniref:GGDEF domain-containing protein n=1 Tax=Candidatus Raymondbacteria bacterium RIFOXYD12_FULL_49_13 TaxID=1817890 RepID=A0A1F7F9L2_UNCRA|nr:MAG: hypothetical protein A2350_03295 [Candidatus Raymondbacteria bacterium RifOxyB12_full_50_8]OGJ93263.1 MAG: hypothetical protein A2248_18010 [Candidatus Raymondbacteria bacterium RIFOXYA2_FULL_49_16]OGJ98168.1 MAG: hypothetical protein A2487_00790 [Candidatus Raymondbacteria bacterium RifOxyC12_full_50_8]OGK03345.1 MAG: hypothetical protein A2519_15355 [Candidatus Raymondbacteria bacterium RIFOXYD12_FULL_49_13]OGP44985.1 MAG: hypothetical protein A2324_19935 [Candidatus Raymondbacteria b
MNIVLEEPRKVKSFLAIVGGLALVAFLGITDYLTGAELSFSIFYLIPITLVTLFSNRMPGLVIACVSAGAWLGADLQAGHEYSHFLIPYWNAAVRLGYFISHTLILSSLLKTIHREKEKSLLDPLTNAANWRYFEEYSRRELERERREKKPITIAYFDLDNFKQVNDTLGHDVGDELLRTVAQLIQTALRPGDMLARVGGDEFVILLAATGYEGAQTALGRIREMVLAEMKSRGWPVSLSIGAIAFSVLPSSIGPMIKRADELMYTIKHSGKNNLKIEQWPPQ